MDILSHGLWGSLASKALNKKESKKINLKWAFFWGVFPDLFAFTIPFIYLIYGLAIGETNFSDFGPPEDSPSPSYASGIFKIAPLLYNYSHSVIIFIIVVVVIRLIWKNWPWVLTGWLFHILADIPTHTAEFYPTPALWPLSEATFQHGISWGQAWFMVLNYGLILVVYLALRARQIRKKTKP